MSVSAAFYAEAKRHLPETKSFKLAYAKRLFSME
jgi:hypothetical protein